MAKNIEYAEDARKALERGVDKVANTVMKHQMLM